MAHSIFGQILAVRKFVNGDIEVDFYHDEKITEYRYSSDTSRLGNFPKELIENLASTLATDICIEIFFGDDGNPTYVELEECDDEDDSEEEEEFDEDNPEE